MLPSSAIRVIENTSSRLVILNPPYYSLGFNFLLLCTVSALGFFLLTRTKIYTMMKFRWIIPSIICVFVVVALSLLFSKSYITFSKETGKMLVQRWSAGIPRGTVEVPLDQIKYVTVENFSGARTMTVVLTNGDTVRLGNFTDQGGEFGAVDTINGFLGRSRIKP